MDIFLQAHLSGDLVWFPDSVVGVAIFASPRANSGPSLPFLIVPPIMIIFGFFIMKKLVFDLVDEVWEDGDSLLVKNRGREEHIALHDIKNVSYSPFHARRKHA